MKGYCTFSSLGHYGRFANQIFQIAGTIGIARKNGMLPVFPVWRNYDHGERFGSREDIEIHKHMVHRLPSIEKGTEIDGAMAFVSRPVEWGYHDVQLLPGNWDLSGHFQSLKYFDHCIDEVRYYMEMKDEPKEIMPFIAIHARRGDYDNKYHPVIPVDYYVKAIEHCPTDSEFLVFSDDKGFYIELTRACIDHGLTKQSQKLYPVNGNYLSSFAIMKCCMHFIIGNSSYSAAAAILSDYPDKQVIAPKNWFGPAYTNITAKDIYCPDWKII